jgi:hypothetical protein
MYDYLRFNQRSLREKKLYVKDQVTIWWVYYKLSGRKLDQKSRHQILKTSKIKWIWVFSKILSKSMTLSLFEKNNLAAVWHVWTKNDLNEGSLATKGVGLQWNQENGLQLSMMMATQLWVHWRWIVFFKWITWCVNCTSIKLFLSSPGER